MTYSLHTLTRSDAALPTPPGVRRFKHEIGLILGLLLLLFWLLALLSYAPQDAAWSTSGTGAALHNWGGRLGAWLADMSYFLLGYSAWWGPAVLAHTLLATLAQWMRVEDGQLAPAPPSRSARIVFWGGLALLLCASAALEWSRLYRLEPYLPGHGGGVLGFWLGPLATKWLGFTGSALVAIALGVVGAGMVFAFSWAQVAEMPRCSATWNAVSGPAARMWSTTVLRGAAVIPRVSSPDRARRRAS